MELESGHAGSPRCHSEATCSTVPTDTTEEARAQRAREGGKTQKSGVSGGERPQVQDPAPARSPNQAAPLSLEPPTRSWIFTKNSHVWPKTLEVGLHLNDNRILLFVTEPVHRLSFFCLLFRAAAEAYGGSQARGSIGAVAASLHQSHRNGGSEPYLTATLDP